MKKLIASCGLALATLLSVVPAHAAPVLLTFTPSSTHVNVGDNVTINATISGLGADILSAYDLNFRYSGADSFLLFTFTLMGVADGVTSFTLGPDLDFERNFVGLNALSLDVNVASACIAIGTGQCVQQLPEPASLALVGVAMLGALAPRALRRYRKTTTA